MEHTKTWEVIRMGCSALLMLAFCATAMAQEPAAGSAAHVGEDAMKAGGRDPAAVAQSSRSAARDLDGTSTPTSRSAARDLDGANTPATFTGSRAADPVVTVNTTTLAVLLANCPKGMSEADWLKLMANPVNASLYPLRITQAMLDTLDAEKLDLRYQYVLIPNEPQHHGPQVR